MLLEYIIIYITVVKPWRTCVLVKCSDNKRRAHSDGEPYVKPCKGLTLNGHSKSENRTYTYVRTHIGVENVRNGVYTAYTSINVAYKQEADR